MFFNPISNIESCYVNIPHLSYYSHIPTAIIALLLGFFVYFKNKNSLTSKILLFTALSFTVWSILDLSLWISIDSRKIMFSWSIINLFEMFASSSTLYFAYVFLEKRDIPLLYKIIVGLPLVIFMLFIPSTLNLTGFDSPNCEAGQGIFKYYFYIFEILIFLCLLIYLIKKIVTSKLEERKMTIYFSIGAICFLASFSGANVLGSITENWQILQYGLFGMPVFMGFLVYLIVKYEAFNIKLIATQALILSLVGIIASELFFVKDSTNQILVLVSLALSVGFGYMLLRSVKAEIKRKEELQKITTQLAIANDKLRMLDNAKSEFISIASHQLRTPLTAVKGFVSLLLEGSYGKVSPEVESVLNKVYISNERLIALVEDLLNLSRIESGRMEYNFEKIEMGELCREVYDTFTIRAREKKLSLELKIPGEEKFFATTDKNKVREVISNLVDNALKYTIKGGVKITLSKTGSEVCVAVSDTGIGIPKEEMSYLFQKFSRGKDTSRLNAGGTGLGLHVGKKIMDALHGRVWVESKGASLGSTFFVEVPVQAEETK